MQWIEELRKNGYVQLNNFLPRDEALMYRNNILKATHFKIWSLLSTPYGPGCNIKDEISTSIIDKTRHRQAVSAYKRRQFSFSFYRSSNKHAKAHHSSAIHQSFSHKMLQQLKPLLGEQGKVRDSFFASFIKGQFINYHTDGSAGKYAFIYQLSSGWQHRFGGHLELYPRKVKFYKKSLVPKFNSLAILKLDHPMPHSVRILNNPSHKHRITISGWLE